jgi:hypothetical protein
MIPALVTAAGERASMRFLEFFAANIHNPHTRQVYARAAEEFPAGARAAACCQPRPCSRCTSPPGSRRREEGLHLEARGKRVNI